MRTVNNEIFRWARERSGMSVERLVKYFPKYPEWEVGEANPTFRQLENLARKTYTPLGYFFLTEPPEEKLPIPDFRTLDDTQVSRPSPGLLETIYTMQQRQSWMRTFLLEEGEEPLKFVGSISLRNDIVQTANAIRNSLDIPNNWGKEHNTWQAAFIALREAVENSGVLVSSSGIVGNNTHWKLDVEEFRGFVLVDEYAPLIFINASDFKAAQMFTLIHELVHVWLGMEGVINPRDLQSGHGEAEKYCNQVAAEFLVPAEQLQKEWSEFRTSRDIYRAVAKHFKVSTIVAARRLLELRYINRQGFLKFYRSYLRDERRKLEQKEGGGDFYKTQTSRLGKRFATAVLRAVGDGRLLYTEAFKLTGLKGPSFDKLAAKI